MLSIITSKDGDVVHVHADQDGLNRLANIVARLQKQLAEGACEDAHLFSESWGTGELTESMLSQEAEHQFHQVHHLKFHSWTEEWRIKHGL